MPPMLGRVGWVIVQENVFQLPVESLLVPAIINQREVLLYFIKKIMQARFCDWLLSFVNLLLSLKRP
jgi:hypothetical protein